jgi:protein-arginine kinase activator protein McsA
MKTHEQLITLQNELNEHAAAHARAIEIITQLREFNAKLFYAINKKDDNTANEVRESINKLRFEYLELTRVFLQL